MARYTPKLRPAGAGGGPARPRKPSTRAGSPASKKVVKKSAKPGKFACPVCDKGFNTEEARATHARDAHGQPIDLAAMSPVKPNMVRCPECAAPVRKRNLEHHLRFVHETV